MLFFIKSRIAILSIVLCFLFSACLEIEEKTTFTSADSGNFSLAVDVSKLLAKLKVFGGGEQFKNFPLKDTTISFRNILRNDTIFSPQEKLLLADGNVQMNINADSDQLKLVFSAPFASISQVAGLRNAMFKIIAQSGKNAIPGMNEGASIANSISVINLNDLGFSYKAGNGSISNTLKDSANIQRLVEQDSTLQQIKMISPLLDIPSTYTQVFTFTKPIKNYVANMAIVSTDKKTIIIKNDLQELFENPKALEYSISY
jgi:hypothetical protein